VIDLARFLVGEIKTVSGLTETFIKERPGAGGQMEKVTVDDAFESIVQFENGAIGTIEASRFSLGRKNHQVVEVNGSKGSIEFNLERLNELQVHIPGSDLPEAQGFRDVLVTEGSHPYMGVWWPHGHIIGWEHTFVHEINHFFEAIINNTSVAPYGADFEDGYRCAVVCDAIIESSRTGRRIDLTY
jgi:predicted dehydrogenase